MMNGADSDIDHDSLFGSPPPSPGRGRSPSLALPSASCSAHENVGTIALPGSHVSSELPVNLIAPYANSHSRLDSSQWRSAPLDGPFYAPIKPKASGHKKTRPRVTSTSPGPTTPALLSLDPGKPPRHFLRNQTSLLGLAGVVGGVKPSHLPSRSTPGASANNPIIIDDRTHPTVSIARTSHLPQVDLAELPTPSREQVVSSLINQRNIFPVLKSIIALLGGAISSSPPRVTSRTGFERRPLDRASEQQRGPDGWALPDSRPSKRKKLRHVPAGATDWDVPYPFPESEGPSDYHASWEKKRGKKLITQLVSLVTEAVHKAATKSLAQKHRRELHEGIPVLCNSVGVGDTSSDTSSDALTNTGLAQIHGDHSDHMVSSNLTSSQSAALNEMVATLLKMESSGERTSPGAGQGIGVNSAEASESASDNFQIELDRWCSAIDACLADGDSTASMSGYSATVTNSPTSTSSTRFPTPSESNKENTAPGEDIALTNVIIPCSPNWQSDFDFAIDPVLLGLSSSQLPTHSYIINAPRIPETPSVTSTRSSDFMSLSACSLTPEEIFHTMQDLIIDSPGSSASATSLVAASATESFESPAQQPSVMASTFPGGDCLSLTCHTGTERGYISPPDQMPCQHNSILLNDHSLGLSEPPTKPLNRQDILKQAKAQREILAMEIARAKIELWETTIEQGALVHLTKDEQLSSEGRS